MEVRCGESPAHDRDATIRADSRHQIIMLIAGTPPNGRRWPGGMRKFDNPEDVMRLVLCATAGVAITIGVTGAYAQSVISRTINNEPVETTVVQGPNGTLITRRPLAGPIAPAPVAPLATLAPAAPVVTEDMRVGSAAYLDETVGVAPPPRHATTRPSTRVVHAVHHETHALAHTERHALHAVRRGPLVLAPAQRRVIYRTIVQQQVVPPAVVPAPPPGYPPYPASAVVPPHATTGYAVTSATDYDYDDVYPERGAPPYPAAPYTIGSVLPSNVVLTPLPATVVAEVPAVRPYSYLTVDGRVLLVDPATYTVVADITP